MILRKVYDKFGSEFNLHDEVWEHIKRFHPEIQTIDIIEDILKNPEAIVRNKWDENSKLYYKKYGHLFRAVVVQMEEKRIKTTLTTDKIKKGEIIWEE